MIMFEKNFAKLHFPIKKIFFVKDELSKNHEKKKKIVKDTSLLSPIFSPSSFSLLSSCEAHQKRKRLVVYEIGVRLYGTR